MSWKKYSWTTVQAHAELLTTIKEKYLYVKTVYREIADDPNKPEYKKVYSRVGSIEDDPEFVRWKEIRDKCAALMTKYENQMDLQKEIQKESKIFNRTQDSKERWDGAGIYFEWTELNPEEIARIEDFINNQLQDAQARLDWIDKFYIEHKYHLPKIEEADHKYGMGALRYADELRETCTRIRDRWEGDLNLGSQKKSRDSISGPGTAQTAEPKAAGESTKVKKLTIAQQVWVLHYLLEESGMSYDAVDKTEIAKNIIAITGEGLENTYKRVLKKDQETEKGTQKDLAAVRLWFERLGMLHIVKKIDKERDFG
jgi:hypothetical protein